MRYSDQPRLSLRGAPPGGVIVRQGADAQGTGGRSGRPTALGIARPFDADRHDRQIGDGRPERRRDARIIDRDVEQDRERVRVAEAQVEHAVEDGRVAAQLVVARRAVDIGGVRVALDHVEPGEQAGVVQHGREQAGRAALADDDAAVDEHDAGQVAAPRAGPAGAAPQREHLAGVDPDAMQRGGHQSLVVALGGGVSLLAGVDDARQLVAGEPVRERGGVATAAREDDAAAAVAEVAPRDGHLRAQPVGQPATAGAAHPHRHAPRRSCGAARRRDAVHGGGGGRRMHGTPGARPRRGEVVVPPSRFPVSLHGSPPGRRSQRGRGGSGGIGAPREGVGGPAALPRDDRDAAAQSLIGRLP